MMSKIVCFFLDLGCISVVLIMSKVVFYANFIQISEVMFDRLGKRFVFLYYIKTELVNLLCLNYVSWPTNARLAVEKSVVKV